MDNNDARSLANAIGTVTALEYKSTVEAATYKVLGLVAADPDALRQVAESLAGALRHLAGSLDAIAHGEQLPEPGPQDGR